MAQFRRWRIWLWLAVFSALSTAPCACLAALPVAQAQTCAAERASAPAAAHHEVAIAPMCERCPGAAKSSKPRTGPCPDAPTPKAANEPASDHPAHGDCACGCRWKDGPSAPQERTTLNVPLSSTAILQPAVQSLPRPEFETIARIAQRGLSPPQFLPPRSLPARAPPLTCGRSDFRTAT